MRGCRHAGARHRGGVALRGQSQGPAGEWGDVGCGLVGMHRPGEQRGGYRQRARYSVQDEEREARWLRQGDNAHPLCHEGPYIRAASSEPEACTAKGPLEEWRGVQMTDAGRIRCRSGVGRGRGIVRVEEAIGSGCVNIGCQAHKGYIRSVYR